MGIKGRRRKLRERELRDALEGDGTSEDAETELNVMGDGPFRPPVDAHRRLRLKKTELFNLQDLEYLEHIKEEHQNRRTSHLQGSKRSRKALEEVSEIEDEFLGNRYESEEALAKLTAPLSDGGSTPNDEDVFRKRQKAGTGALFCHPLIGLNEAVVKALSAEGYKRMTLIQERTIPYAMEGYDLLGQARTGSGKTLAFCIPILHVTMDFVRKNPAATVALIMAPTKELCVQTHDVLASVCQHIPATTAAFSLQIITGGTKVMEERRQLTVGKSIVVGTPGRLHDHAKHCKGWNLGHLRFLVLDEADRMLADGFQLDLDAVLSQLPKSRQTFLFSATNSKSVRELARLSLSRTPIFIGTSGDAPVPVQRESGDSLGQQATALVLDGSLPPYRTFVDPDEGGENTAVDGDSSRKSRRDEDGDNAAGEGDAIPSTLQQFCHIVPVEDRLRSLYLFVKRTARTCKSMIFCSTVASVTFHFQMIGSVGFHDDVMMLHGHMKHRQRLQAFRHFNEWRTGVLFCTDVAARGLDIPNVEWILQYDPPLDPTEYIHRIGRTARAGNVGSALLFLSPEEVHFVRYLSQFGIHLQRYPAPAKWPAIQEKLEHVLQLDPVVAKSAVTAYRAHVGAYQSHILKETFNVRSLDLDRLAHAFALTSAPKVTLPKNVAEEKTTEYVKGKLRSLNRRRAEALRHYEAMKTKQQWSDGHFVGLAKPS